MVFVRPQIEMVDAEIKEHAAPQVVLVPPIRPVHCESCPGRESGVHRFQGSQAAAIDHFSRPANQAVPAQIESYEHFAGRRSRPFCELVRFV